MRDFIKFTFASCLGVFIALALMSIILVSIGVSSASRIAVAVKPKSVLHIAPEYLMPELTNNTQPGFSSFEIQDRIGIQELIRQIERAKTDNNIEGILIDPSKTPIGMTQARDVIKALEDFRESGKFVLSYANFYEQPDYYLATAADQIMLNPVGMVDFRGFASFVPFYKELFDKIGVKMQIYYAGEFKSATEPFRRTEMSPENKYQTREYLDDLYNEFLRQIAVSRGLTVDKLRGLANDLAIRNPEDALSAGLIDAIGHEDAAQSWMRERMNIDEKTKINLIDLGDYYTSDKGSGGTASDRIAVVFAEGTIVHGSSEYGLVSDKEYTKTLADLRKNDRIKAVVLRVNSPGGSILASENILREVKLLQEAGKPVVVSMSDLAASGGYYISCTADSIFAEPSTLTGSIGVFMLMPNPHELLKDKLGIGFDTVRTAMHSASFSPFFAWTDAEDNYMQSITDDYYKLFLQIVADGRDMPVSRVDSIARGRVWSGIDALEVGLVDRIGNLEDAVRATATLADLEDYRVLEYPRLKDPLTKMLSDLTGQELNATVEAYTERQLTKEFPAYRELKGMLESREPQARLPVIIAY